MTLATICDNALKELAGFAIPSTFYGNGDGTATLAVALVNREGQTLEKEHRWQELVTEHTFATVSGTATYALPSDFRAFANMSQWDRANQRRMIGPINSAIYQYLQSGITVFGGPERFFMVRGNLFTVYPTPTSADTIAFDYYSKAWITKQTDSTNVSAWTADGDTARIDEDLLTMGLKWRFLQAKGMPFEPEYKEYESVKELLQADNGGRPVINMNGSVAGRQEMGNLPDTGYGS